MRFISLLIVASFIQAGTIQTAETKNLTVSQRQEILTQKICRAEKSNQLTRKEAQKLKDDNASISNKIARMKNRNNGKLSYEDLAELEKDLNKLSTKLHKNQLAKRVSD